MAQQIHHHFNYQNVVTIQLNTDLQSSVIHLPQPSAGRTCRPFGPMPTFTAAISRADVPAVWSNADIYHSHQQGGRTGRLVQCRHLPQPAAERTCRPFGPMPTFTTASSMADVPAVWSNADVYHSQQEGGRAGRLVQCRRF